MCHVPARLVTQPASRHNIPLLIALLLLALPMPACKFISYEVSPRPEESYALPFPRNDWPCTDESMEKVHAWTMPWRRYHYRRQDYGLKGIEIVPLAPLPPWGEQAEGYGRGVWAGHDIDLTIELGAQGLRLDLAPVDLDQEPTLIKDRLVAVWEQHLKWASLARSEPRYRPRVVIAIEPSVSMRQVAQVIAMLVEQDVTPPVALHFLFSEPLPAELEPIPEALVAKLAADYVPPPYVAAMIKLNPRNVPWFWGDYLHEQTDRATRWCPWLAWFERSSPSWTTHYRTAAQRYGIWASRMVFLWRSCSCNADIEVLLAKYYADLGLGRIDAPLADIRLRVTQEDDSVTSQVVFQMHEDWAQSVNRLTVDITTFCFEGEGVPDPLSCKLRDDAR